MNEKPLFEGIIISPVRNNPFEDDPRNYERLTVLNTAEELAQAELSGKTAVYRAPSEVVSSFLMEKFGYDISGFMEMYTKLHFKRLAIGNGEGFAFPVPPITCCYFAEYSDPTELAKRLSNYQASIIRDEHGDTMLNLHNDTVYKFTVIRAKFNLAEAKDQFYFGYHFTTEKFRLFIKSSIQFDLTVVYEEL